MVNLRHFLVDLQQRCTEAERTIAKLEQTLRPEAKSYAERIRKKNLEKARERIAAHLADPDLLDQFFIRTNYSSYRRLVELLSRIEETSILALSRYADCDRFASLLADQIAKEMGYSGPAPLCSATSTQYFFAELGLDLIFLPCTEAYRLLSIADLYHELAHFTLTRFNAQFLAPLQREIDQHFDEALKEARRKRRVRELIKEVQDRRQNWKQRWVEEVAADMIATYCAGPAYGWCNIRVCSNLSANLFDGGSKHPADAARAAGIEIMLRQIGCADEARELELNWKALENLATGRKPQGFHHAYPTSLLQALSERIVVACKQVGLRPYKLGSESSSSTNVTQLLNSAWKEFRANPHGFADWEKSAIGRLKAVFKI